MSDAAEKLPFDIETNEGSMIVHLRGNWDASGAETFTTVVSEAISKQPVHLIVECVGLFMLNSHWSRAFVGIAQILKKNQKELRLVGVPVPVQKQLKADGLASTLKTASSQQQALVELGLARAQVLDVKFINPFLAATVAVLETQAQTKATQGRVFKKAPGDKFTGDISGVIGLVSDHFTGSVVISFPAATFLKIMSRMLGEDYKEITQEIQDGAGELTNIIFGHAKVALNTQGFGIKTALPSIVSGKDHSIVQATQGPRVAIPFESEAGPFVVEICLSQ